jgi:hypothetical protein
MTQELTLKALDKEATLAERTGYAEQRALAHRVRRLCGDGAIEKLYFQGDPSELRECLDRSLGKAGAEQLRKKLSATA